MTIEKSFLYVLLVPASVITFVLMRLKQIKKTVCLLTFFCLISLCVYFSPAFPLEFAPGVFQRARPFSSSAVPFKNIVCSLNLYPVYPDGSTERHLGYFNSLVRISVLDFVMSLLISAGFYQTIKKAKAALIASFAFCFPVLSVRIALYLIHSTQLWFDTAEFFVVSIGIAGGYLLSYTIQKYKTIKQ